MTVTEIRGLKRNDSPIYYRMLYEGVAVLEFAGKSNECKIDFVIETKPTGQRDITISFVTEPDFPLIPLKSAIKEKIEELYKSDKLPAL
jgi:hypothetical protein